MDWSEKGSCIKCNEGGAVLVCSENGCPLAIHEGCMSCPARFDGGGHFYCPYCLYKQAVAELRQAREYALARKKALLIFMDEDTIVGEKQSKVNEGAEVNGHNQSKVSVENVNITCADDKSRHNSVTSLNQSIHLDEEHNISNAEEEKIQEEEIEASAGSKGQDPSLQMPEEQKIINEEDRNIHDEEHEASAASSSQDPSIKIHEHGFCSANEEKILEEERETSSASSGLDSLPLRERAKRASKRRKTMRSNSEVVSVKSKSVKQSDKNKQTSPTVNSPRRSSRRSSSALRTEDVIKEKIDVSKRLKQPELPSVKLASDTFGSGKRKRLLWREEEEEMLKAGVQKYSKEPIKNLPWRKILDMGRLVFDGTRTPSDLKDKWRNMSTK